MLVPDDHHHYPHQEEEEEEDENQEDQLLLPRDKSNSTITTATHYQSTSHTHRHQQSLTDENTTAVPTATNNNIHQGRQVSQYSAAYQVLEQANLLVTTYRKESFSDIFEEGDLDPNSTLSNNFAKKWQWGVYWTPGCGWMLYKIFHKEIIVPPGHLVCFTDENDNHIFARPGIHNIQNPFFFKQRGGPIALYGSQNHRNIIEHGNRCVFVVPEGMIGYATDMGRPVLLPPGLHCWKSDTLRLERMYKLDDGASSSSPVLPIGPLWTIVTVEEGCFAITVENGKQVLLQGGKTYLLTHPKWKFERFVSMTIQSEDLRQVRVATADNILMNVDATCVWKIVDIEKAAIVLKEPSSTYMMRSSDISMGTLTDDDNTGGGLSKLRRDVLKQTVSAIARFVSEVNYSEYFNAVSSAMRRRTASGGDDDVEELNDSGNTQKLSATTTTMHTFDNPMFHHERLKKCVVDANTITSELGVEIISVSIIAASPTNASLMNSLLTSAIASAEALQAETHARGMAQTMEMEARAAATARQIESESDAKALLTRARADAEAEVLRSEGAKEAEMMRAEGVKEAAKMIETSHLASTLETIKASAMAIKDSDKFFFGEHPDYMAKLMRSEGV